MGCVGGTDALGKAEDNGDDIFKQDSDCWETNPHALFHVSLICVQA